NAATLGVVREVERVAAPVGAADHAVELVPLETERRPESIDPGNQVTRGVIVVLKEKAPVLRVRFVAQQQATDTPTGNPIENDRPPERIDDLDQAPGHVVTEFDLSPAQPKAAKRRRVAGVAELEHLHGFEGLQQLVAIVSTPRQRQSRSARRLTWRQKREWHLRAERIRVVQTIEIAG